MKRTSTDVRHSMVASTLAAAAHLHLNQLIDQLINSISARRGGGKRSDEAPTLSADFEYLTQRLSNIAHALALWHSTEVYLDAEGAPRELPLRGKHSVSSIAEALTSSKSAAAQLVKDLLSLGCIETRGPKFLPRGKSLVIEENNAFALAYATAAISHLISTITKNFSAVGTPRYERQLAEVKIRKSDMPLFLKFTEQQGQYLIDAVDDWLEQRRISPSSEKESVSVGIGAFAWTSNERGTKTRTSKRKQVAQPR